MPTTEAHVATAHASRYLQQLCKHWSHRFTVSFTPEAGTIDFGDGRACTLAATPDTLALRATAGTDADPAALERVIAEHVSRFAFREDLVFAWHPAEG